MQVINSIRDGVKPERDPEGLHEVDAPVRLIVGREAGVDLRFPHPEVSRRHAALVRTLHGDYLEDLGSANGTYVGSQALRPGERHPLREGDAVLLGGLELCYRQRTLIEVPPSQPEEIRSVRVDVRNLRQVVRRRGREWVLLDDVSFTVYPREVVGIVGASGAGKSTLVNALNGMRPAVAGSVLYNHLSFYEDPEAFRGVIGYVPQEDIVHRQLTVASVLRYAAELRLPPESSSTEIEARLEAVLAELELTHRRDAVVSTLSGGERKRVNIGVELLTRPSLLLLDEPTSGLDPGLERRVVALIRRLAGEGRTLLFVTHATESISQCDLVLFLAPGGHVAFYGPPAAALEFFGVEEFAEAYLKLNGDRDAEGHNPWPERFRHSPHYETYVVQRRRCSGQSPEDAARVSSLERRPTLSPTRQLALLGRRYLEVMKGDRRNLGVLLLQAPLIAGIVGAIYPANVFTDDLPRSAGAAPPVKDAGELLFLLVIAALWFGTINSAREISKERAIYLRERLAGLRVWPYLLSKVGVLGLLCLIQAGMLLVGVGARIDFHAEGVAWWQLFGVLSMASLAATMQGLLLSSFSNSTDQAASLVPLVLLPQVIFSGMLLGLDDLGPFRAVANVMPGRWVYGGLAALTRLPDLYADTGISRNVKDVFYTDPAAALVALAVISLACLVAAATALTSRQTAR